jgi:hypothetical protein
MISNIYRELGPASPAHLHSSDVRDERFMVRVVIGYQPIAYTATGAAM